MALQVIVPKNEFMRKFKRFEDKWCSGLKFIRYTENGSDYKESRRFTNEQQLKADFIALRNSLLQE